MIRTRTNFVTVNNKRIQYSPTPKKTAFIKKVCVNIDVGNVANLDVTEIFPK